MKEAFSTIEKRQDKSPPAAQLGSDQPPTAMDVDFDIDDDFIDNVVSISEHN